MSPLVVERRVAKKEKDPNAPKRAVSAYFLFAADKRESIKQANPGTKVTDISRITGGEAVG